MAAAFDIVRSYVNRLVALAKRKQPRVRFAEEFRTNALRTTLAPYQSSMAYSWDLTAIMAARDEQMRGVFRTPVRLAASMRTDDALAVAYRNRLAPQRALAVRLVAASGARGARIAAEAEDLFGDKGVAVTRETLADINGALANHGVAIGHNKRTARPDGSRIDFVHSAWPMEFVAWDAARRTLYTQVDRASGATFVDIVHGDGEWTIYATHENLPWQQDAAILPGALVWGRHAFPARDWIKGSASHGNAKVVGQLEAGTPLQATNEDGVVGLSEEAAAYLALLQDVASLDCPVGIAPAGSTMQYMTNSSRAWEVWAKLMENSEKAAARIYLGTDGTLGSQGGAPGVDIAELFGVATTITQGDLGAITRGLQTGLIDPWCAVNYGDSSLAPQREYVIPDPDAKRVREEQQKNETAFAAAIVARRAAGLVITQAVVDELAERYGVVGGELAATQTSGMVLTPSTVEKIARVDEGRQAVGLLPVGGDEGSKWIAEVGQADAPPTSAVRAA